MNFQQSSIKVVRYRLVTYGVCGSVSLLKQDFKDGTLQFDELPEGLSFRNVLKRRHLARLHDDIIENSRTFDAVVDVRDNQSDKSIGRIHITFFMNLDSDRPFLVI